MLGLDFLAFDFFFLALAAFLLVAGFEEVELSLPLDLALESLESSPGGAGVFPFPADFLAFSFDFL